MSDQPQRRRPLVFVDTNVLFPVRLADLVLSSVDDGLIELCVSDRLLNEIEQVLIDGKGLSVDKARVFRDAVAANATRRISDDECRSLRAQLSGPDPDDLWHLAAAVAGAATALITSNINDYATVAIPTGHPSVEILRPDTYFSRLASSGLCGDLLDTIIRISERLRNPPLTVEQILDMLAQSGMGETAQLLRDQYGEHE